MKKLKRILLLSDPYPNLWYEVSCYLKAALGLVLFILGLFLVFSPQFNSFLGILLMALGFLVFGQIKLVRNLIKILSS